MNLYCVIYVYILTIIVNSTKLFIISYEILDKKSPFIKKRLIWVEDRSRTDDLLDHNQAL